VPERWNEQSFKDFCHCRIYDPGDRRRNNKTHAELAAKCSDLEVNPCGSAA